MKTFPLGTPQTLGIVSFILLTAVAAGCTHTSNAPPPAVHAARLNEAGVLAIARRAVAANDTWVQQADFEKPRRQPDGSWSVLV